MIYLLLFILSFILTYMVKEYAIKKALFDIPNDRSSHTVATPHGGGIAIAITWFLGISYLYYTNDMNSALYFSLMTGVIISVVSYLDDLYALSPKVRILIQSLVAVLGLYFLTGFSSIDIGILTIENQLMTNIFAFFIIVWFINLYNFLDGIDGYAGAEAIFLGVAAYLLWGGDHFLVLIASILGFLIWNWHKAKIFMGDVGSTLLGYNVAIFTLYYSNEHSSNLWIWGILFGLFWFDATLTLVRRYRNKEKLSQAHKKHAYQRLHQSNWSHSKIVTYSIVVNSILFSFIYFIPNVIIAFVISLVCLYGIIMFVDSKKGFTE